jgi:hypothetical protein
LSLLKVINVDKFLILVQLYLKVVKNKSQDKVYKFKEKILVKKRSLSKSSNRFLESKDAKSYKEPNQKRKSKFFVC